MSRIVPSDGGGGGAAATGFGKCHFFDWSARMASSSRKSVSKTPLRPVAADKGTKRTADAYEAEVDNKYGDALAATLMFQQTPPRAIAAAVIEERGGTANEATMAEVYKRVLEAFGPPLRDARSITSYHSMTDRDLKGRPERAAEVAALEASATSGARETRMLRSATATISVEDDDLRRILATNMIDE